MPKRSIRSLLMAALALFIVAGFLLVDSSAQRRRKRRTSRSRPSAPRITNPAIYQPSPGDNSTDTNSATDNTNAQTTPATDQDPETRKTIRSLSNQVDRLSDKINQMEESQRSLVDLERLSRAEQRSAQLRTELRDVQAKQAELEARAEDVDYALKPENIERSVAGYGTTHPEELRAQRRRQLENEKERVRKQLDQLNESELRLQEAIATSDTEAERLRKRLDAADAATIQNSQSKPQSEGTAPQTRTSASPSPTPY